MVFMYRKESLCFFGSENTLTFIMNLVQSLELQHVKLVKVISTTYFWSACSTEYFVYFHDFDLLVFVKCPQTYTFVCFDTNIIEQRQKR
jgi:hypothetical protein